MMYYRNEFSIFIDHKSDPIEPIFIEGDDPDEHQSLEVTEQQRDTDSDSDQEEEIPANNRDSQSPEPQDNIIAVTVTIEPQQSGADVENPAYFNVTSDADGEGD